MMQIVYYGDDMPESFSSSIFLAGGSLRPGQEGVSWRREAIQILAQLGYDGVVFIPENRKGVFDDDHNYQETVEWEEKFLEICDCILFWIPRDLRNLPCLTTNCEFGKYSASGKIVLGIPDTAEKVKYQKYYASKLEIPFSSSLLETVKNAITLIGAPVHRTGGERYIPIHIWKTNQFQNWYKSHKNIGNILEYAKVLYTYYHIPKKYGIFLFILRTHIFIAAENRTKYFDFTLARNDISSVLLYHKGTSLQTASFILVKEFRPSVSNSIAYVIELPSGSSASSQYSPLELAVQEVREEVGFEIAPERLQFIGARQLIGTLSAHKAHLFAAEITTEELAWFKTQHGIAHGEQDLGERTYVQVFSYQDLFQDDVLDWTTIGQILLILCQENRQDKPGG